MKAPSDYRTQPHGPSPAGAHESERARQTLAEDFLAIPGLQRTVRYSHGVTGTGNALILGDNSNILPRLRKTMEGRVRCIYIDPPYNNGEEYAHYRDRLDHPTWLRTMKSTLQQLAPLLTEDGSIWISIDDGEVHYLKIIADELFGRKNFVSTIVWQHRTTRENRTAFSNNHEYVLVYARDVKTFTSTRNGLTFPADVLRRYRNPDDDPRGPWQSVSANVQAGHATPSQFYTVTAPNGKRHLPPRGRCWIYTAERMYEAISRNEIWFGKDGNGVPRLKRYLNDMTVGLTPSTLWTADEVGTTIAAKKHLLSLLPNTEIFETPKPESLVARIIEIASDPNDIVLDAFLGSGTTAAVAHKMGRRYVGIEVGLQAITHCAQRLELVIQGEGGGISGSVDWRGGGGFDFFEDIRA